MNDRIGSLLILLAAVAVTVYCIRKYRNAARSIDADLDSLRDPGMGDPLTVDEVEWDHEVQASIGVKYVDLEHWLRNRDGGAA